MVYLKFPKYFLKIFATFIPESFPAILFFKYQKDGKYYGGLSIHTIEFG